MPIILILAALSLCTASAGEPSPDNSDDPFGVVGFNTRGKTNTPKPVPNKNRRNTFEMKSQLLDLHERLALHESELKQLNNSIRAPAEKLGIWAGIVEYCKKVDAEKKQIGDDRKTPISAREPKITELENEKSRYLRAVKNWDGDLMDAIKEVRTEVDVLNAAIAQKTKSVTELKQKIDALQKELKDTEAENIQADIGVKK